MNSVPERLADDACGDWDDPGDWSAVHDEARDAWLDELPDAPPGAHQVGRCESYNTAESRDYERWLAGVARWRASRGEGPLTLAERTRLPQVIAADLEGEWLGSKDHALAEFVAERYPGLWRRLRSKHLTDGTPEPRHEPTMPTVVLAGRPSRCGPRARERRAHRTRSRASIRGPDDDPHEPSPLRPDRRRGRLVRSPQAHELVAAYATCRDEAAAGVVL